MDRRKTAGGLPGPHRRARRLTVIEAVERDTKVPDPPDALIAQAGIKAGPDGAAGSSLVSDDVRYLDIAMHSNCWGEHLVCARPWSGG